MDRRNIEFWIDRSRAEKAVVSAGTMVGAGVGVGVCYYLSPEPPKTMLLLNDMVNAISAAGGGAYEQTHGESQQSQATQNGQEPMPIGYELAIIGAGALVGAALYGVWATRYSHRQRRKTLLQEANRITQEHSSQAANTQSPED